MTPTRSAGWLTAERAPTSRSGAALGIGTQPRFGSRRLIGLPISAAYRSSCLSPSASKPDTTPPPLSAPVSAHGHPRRKGGDILFQSSSCWDTARPPAGKEGERGERGTGSNRDFWSPTKCDIGFEPVPLFPLFLPGRDARGARGEHPRRLRAGAIRDAATAGSQENVAIQESLCRLIRRQLGLDEKGRAVGDRRTSSGTRPGRNRFGAASAKAGAATDGSYTAHRGERSESWWAV